MTPRQREIPIARPSVGEEEWQALREPIMNGWLTQGPKVEAFERRFAELHGVKHAVATTSCTTALHLALLAVGTRPGDEVIVPAFTWVASANAVLGMVVLSRLVRLSRRPARADRQGRSCLDDGCAPVSATRRFAIRSADTVIGRQPGRGQGPA